MSTAGTPHCTRQRLLLLLLQTLWLHSSIVNAELVFLGQQPFGAFVSQGSQTGHTFYQFFVIDTQLSNEEPLGVTYSSPQTNELPFVLVPSTGELRISDFLTEEDYFFTVEAVANSITIATNITVTIVPLSDTTPRFEHAQYEIEVSEGLPTLSAFSVIRAFSLSPGSTTQRYSIVQGNTDNDLSINSNTGVLRVDRNLDRERTESYQLIVRYVDDLTSVDTSVQVSVLDVNDQSPQFSKSLYNITIAETISLGTPILTVNASDGDVGVNAELSYILESTAEDTFSLDSDEGILRTAALLDFERQPKYQFRVTVMDKGNPPLSSVATVLVNLMNIDDECPRFENPAFIEELAYDITGTPPAVGTEILTVMATDPDRFSEVTYSIVSGHTDVLDLNPETGVITLANTDSDPRGQYTLNVSASDASCTGMSFVQVEIGIGNVNDHSPQFQTECVAMLHENPPRDTEVVQLQAEDNDIGFNGLVTYSLLSGTELFAIDSSSGVVRTVAGPSMYDRETQSTLQAGVTASDGGGRQDYCLLTVTLRDLNDNAPRIPLSEYGTSLARDSRSGTFVVQITADDPDIGNNSRIQYSIDHPSSLPFEINSISGVVTTTESLTSLDEYSFTVFAADMGTHPLTSSTTVMITLTNSDSLPQFSEMNYTGTVCENPPIGSIALTVNVSNSSPEDFIQFAILSGSDFRSNAEGTFDILESSPSNLADIVIGSMSFVDFERLTPDVSFQFFVRARNTAGSTIVPVEIFVIDVDDNDPDFVTDFSVMILENQPIGTNVGQIQATDLDSGTNGEVLFRYRSGQESPYFNIMSDGRILSNQVFDFETSEDTSGSLIVEAYNPNPLPADETCSGQRRNSESTFIDWVILDQNDNPPSFPLSMYLTEVREDLDIQSRIIKLNATDEDVSDLGRLSFSIISGNDGNFGIEAQYIILTRRLDFETTPTYDLEIQVTDGVHSGQNCPQCITTVRIIVTDIDDEPPVFSSPEYHANVVENAPIGTSVLTISANDTDSPLIQFELTGLAEGRFSINQSGVVSVAGPIDRENFPGGSLVFLAFAEGGSLATADIIIDIEDVNDYEPRFSGEFRGRVEENTAPGEDGLFAGQVRAVDLDQGENGTVRYSILSGEDDGFRIDEESGIITAYAQYDREAMPRYILEIEARDNGTAVQLSSRTQVVIEIGDVNDNPATFSFPYMFSRVFENSPTGHSVIYLPAFDPDNGTNATVAFTLEDSNPDEPKFTLNITTGEVTIIGSLDYEIPQHRLYTLTVSARDPEIPQFSFGTLQIQLIDMNDNSPEVTVQQTAFNLQETFPTGATVATITAVDRDSNENSELMFEISDGNTNNAFVLVATNGGAEIKSADAFDYETTNTYTLTVTVTDGGDPPLSTSEELSFLIIDVNDEAPVFTQSVYEVSIEEESSDPPPVYLIQVEANDPDTGIGGEIARYEILEGNEAGRFALNSSGFLEPLVSSFDREEQSEYVLTVAAYDGGIQPKRGTARIVVTITDINDNPSLDGGHLTVLIYALDGLVAPGVIAPFFFNDPDTDDSFQDCIVRSQNHDATTFMLIQDTCSIGLEPGSPAEGTYDYLEVEGRDGVHTIVSVSATIGVEHFDSSELPLENLVTVTVDVSSEAYITERLNISFPSQLAQILGIPENNIQILTVQQGTYLPDSTVDVTFFATNNNGEVTSSTAILHQLFIQRDSLTINRHSVLNMPLDTCATEPCQNQAGCRTVQRLRPTTKVIDTREFVFFAPRIEFTYECLCPPGTSGEHCEINFDDCYSNPCQQGAECTDLVNGFSCDCPSGYTGVDCSSPPDECSTNLCQNGASCNIVDDSISCKCQPLFYGPLCQYHYFIPSTFCSQENPCQNGAECSSGRDSFSCVCLPGFSGEFCQTETQVQGGCVDYPCYNGSTCEETPEGPVCSCSVGFTGPNCRWPLNICELDPCRNGGTCSPGHYNTHLCTCAPGFTGEDCSAFTDPCISSPCLNGRCHDQRDGTYSCECLSGFYGDNCEYTAEPVDLCLDLDCSNNGTCTSGRDDYTCTCEDNFVGDLCSVFDESNTDLCAGNPCSYGGMCVNSPSSTLGFVCECSPGFNGPLCEANINECAGNPCLNDGTCDDGINGYTCSCPTGISGYNCQILCPQGLTGVFCQTHIPQCDNATCENNGICVDQGASFACVCPPTHTGDRCETQVLCSQTSCLNGGTCVDLPTGGTECVCGPDFSGDACELLTVSFSGSKTESSFRAFNSLNIRGQGRIEFEFATEDQDGLLLFNTQLQNGQSEDYIAVEIVGGALQVSISHGSEDDSLSIMDSPLGVSDGSWHQVVIETAQKDFSVFLDDCLLLPTTLVPFAPCASTATTPGTASFLDLGLPLWIGGVPFPITSNMTHISSQGVTGCIRGVKIDGRTLDLEGYVFESNSRRGCVHLESEVCMDNSTACGEGVCVSMFNGYVCDCPARTEGGACEKPATRVMYGGGVFAKYSLLKYQSESAAVKRQATAVSLRSTVSDQVSLWLRTEMENGQGLLLYMGSEDLRGEFYLQLEEGTPVLHVNLGSLEEQFTLTDQVIADSQWHFVEVVRSALELTTTVDNITSQFTLRGTQLSLDLTPIIFVGGRPGSGVSEILTPYTGCIEDIRIDQTPLPTSGMNEFASVVFSGSSEVSYNCALGACLRQPCGRGNCTEREGGNFECSCDVGVRTISQRCPLEVPPPMYTLAIVSGLVAGGLLVCSFIVLLCMLTYRYYSSRKNKLDLSTGNEGGLDILNRQCLVISNEAGGGERDTHIGLDEITSTLFTNPAAQEEEKKKQSSELESSSNSSITKPRLAMPRATSPTIETFIKEKIEGVPKDYRDIDSVFEYNEEGNGSVTGSLSSICSSLAESEYTVEKLRQAGPEFAPFIGLLSSVLEEEEEEEMDGGSQQAHTGNTQLTPGYSQDLW